MAGAVTASIAIGMQGADAIAFISDGMRTVATSFPFLRPETSLALWFEGGMNWLSSVGSGLQSWCDLSGLDLSAQVTDALTRMQEHLGDRADQAREIFNRSISRTAEVSALLRDTLRNAMPQTPAEAAKAVIDGLTTVAEGWGIWTAMRDIGSGLMKRVRTRFGRSDAIRDVAENTGLSREAVTTININIAIAGDANRAQVLETVRSGLEAAGLEAAHAGTSGVTPVSLSGAGSRDARADASQAAEPAVSPALPRPTHGAASDRGQPLPTFICGDDVIWASDEISRSMMDGVSDVAILRGSAEFDQITRIEGGIVLREIPKEPAKRAFGDYAKNDTIEPDNMSLQ